ncbi:MAG: hypothetical protein ACT4P2_09450 [Pseudomonadota bacterium]
MSRREGGAALFEALFATDQLAGNSYLEAVRAQEGAPPRELHVLRPDRMKIVSGSTGFPEAYQYEVDGRTTRWPTMSIDIAHHRRLRPPPLDVGAGLETRPRGPVSSRPLQRLAGLITTAEARAALDGERNHDHGFTEPRDDLGRWTEEGGGSRTRRSHDPPAGWRATAALRAASHLRW